METATLPTETASSLPAPMSEVQAKLGVTANQPVWLVTVNYQFLETLPEDQRRIRLMANSDGTMSLMFCRDGAKVYHAPRSLNAIVQIGRLKANIIPGGKYRFASVALRGKFDPLSMDFRFAPPPFIKMITIKPSSGLPRKSHTNAITLQKIPAKHGVWRDQDVRQLMIRLRDCLSQRPDLLVEINDRTVVAQRIRTVIDDF